HRGELALHSVPDDVGQDRHEQPPGAPREQTSGPADRRIDDPELGRRRDPVRRQERAHEHRIALRKVGFRPLPDHLAELVIQRPKLAEKLPPYLVRSETDRRVCRRQSDRQLYPYDTHTDCPRWRPCQGRASRLARNAASFHPWTKGSSPDNLIRGGSSG